MSPEIIVCRIENGFLIRHAGSAVTTRQGAFGIPIAERQTLERYAATPEEAGLHVAAILTAPSSAPVEAAVGESS